MSRTTLGELIRIDGVRPTKPDPYPSYDQNLCVWDGFACGLNLVIPGGQTNDSSAGFSPNAQLLGQDGPCVSGGPPGSPAEWAFIDSHRCRAYYQAPRFFIAIYRQACPGSVAECKDNVGFFEVRDADRCESFDAFKAKVTGANPPGFLQTTSPLKGTYHSIRGQTIEFQAAAGSGRNAGLTAVNGSAQSDVDGWSFAEGSGALLPGTKTPMTSSGDGLVRVWNPRLGKTLELDFRDKDHPDRRVK